MKDIDFFLRDKKVKLLEEYSQALDYGSYNLAKNIRLKLAFIEELIKEAR